MPLEFEELCLRALSAVMMAQKKGMEDTARALIDLVSAIQRSGPVPSRDIERLTQLIEEAFATQGPRH